MPVRRTHLAKLTRPRLHNAVVRERLFAMLDDAREHKPAICVVGPPGAGKTTLVASWLDTRGIKGIWYQVDAGDADLATFFHYLGEAIKLFTRKGQRPLPALTPEYLHDVAGFSRRFFRDLFARLPSGATLALDNYQGVEAQQEFHRLIAEAVNEVPAGITLIAVSRRDPPDCYARLIANEHVAFIDWEDLKLTLGEAGTIVRGRCSVDQEQVIRMHEQSAGWAAGLTLLTERLRRGELPGDTGSPDNLEEIFRYFAGELFDRMTSGEQHILLQLSYLPRMSEAQAVQLTGETEAGQLLEQLYRRHLFVHRRAGDAPTYQFHALFQAFLRHKALECLSQPEQEATMLSAAAVLEHSADTEEAFALYLQAQDGQAARRLVLREAPALISQGRWRVVMERIDALPLDSVRDNAWLLYWRGMAQSNTDPAAARGDLESAYQAAVRTDDRLCQARASAAVIHTYELEYAQFRPMDPWIERLQNLLDEQLPFPDADSELRTLGALLIGMMHRKPDDPRLDTYAERIHSLLTTITDSNLRVIAATYVLSWGSHTGPVEAALRVRDQLEDYLEDPNVTAVNASYSWFILCWHYCLVQDRERCLHAANQGMRIAAEGGLSDAAKKLGPVNVTWLEVHAGNLGAAQASLSQLEQMSTPGYLYDRGTSEDIRAWIAVKQGNPLAAHAHGRVAVDCFDEAACIHHQNTSRISGLWAAVLERDFVGARQRITEIRRITSRVRSVWQEVVLRMTEAWMALACGDHTAAHERLQAAFGLSHDGVYEHAHGLDFIPWMPDLCEVALKARIEVEYVRKLIRRFNWIPPKSRPEQWPWPVRIRTLGSFQVLVGDEPLVFPHKAPRKPLALLKALIAFGISRVPEQKLIDALWPQEDGDLAHESFKVALKRLRKLLCLPQVLTVAEHTVSLNSTEVWVDTESFESALDRGKATEDVSHILELYRGDFLPEETNLPWSAPARERLRRKFLQAVEIMGSRLERQQLWQQALQLYGRALDADPIAEVFYQGLMRCHLRLGQRTEAMSAFRRMRQMLSVTLGLKPSAESEALHKALLEV